MEKLEGMKTKYIVLKVSEIEGWTSLADKLSLDRIIDSILLGRKMQGKEPNSYVVINTDESYIGEIIEIMKKHGHWG